MLELYVNDPAVTALDGFMLVGLFLTVLNNRNVLLVHPGQASEKFLDSLVWHQYIWRYNICERHRC